MVAITEPVQVVVGKPVKASDHNTSADSITEIISVLDSIENSQLIDGSFEQDLTSWVATNISGGSNVIETSVVIHGAKSFKATATGGGGYVDLDSDDFLNVSAGIDDVFIDGRIYPTTGLRVQAWIEWFDSSDVSISTHQFMDYTFSGGELNAWSRFRGWGRAVATARSYKVSFQLGDGSLAGSVYLDGITSRINDPYPWVMLPATVQFISDNNADVTAQVPVIGSAYKAMIGTSGSPTRYVWETDSGAWVSLGTTNENVVSDIDGWNLDESGSFRASSGGAFTVVYQMWR